jgi:hypothetical protein
MTIPLAHFSKASERFDVVEGNRCALAKSEEIKARRSYKIWFAGHFKAFSPPTLITSAMFGSVLVFSFHLSSHGCERH